MQRAEHLSGSQMETMSGREKGPVGLGLQGKGGKSSRSMASAMTRIWSTSPSNCSG